VLQESRYREWLSATEQEEDEIDRIANVDELLNEAGEFDGRYEGDAPLESYLEEVCLANDIDGWESETDRVSLMTLHAAKGLEFPVVFIVAVEQNFLPHTRSQEDPNMVEEERRLLFVGITRAEQELHLSLASYRNWQGSRRMSMPSPFLIELPRDEMEVRGPPRGASTDPLESHFELPPDDDSDWDQSVEADESWGEDSLASPPPTVSDKTGLHVVTASDLLDDTQARPPVDPAAFQSNMVVQHPEFGLGKITTISGKGAKRSANVAFFTSDREKTFVLAFSELRPVKSGTQ
jgi:DNA helicase-2/ATP-dependent DNA helicase PcrA